MLVPRAASNSTRLVHGEDQVACWTRWGMNAATPSASGDVVGDAEPLTEVAPVHFRQIACSSQKIEILFRGEACTVSRALSPSHVRSEYAGRSRSGTYVQTSARPAFWLKNRFAVSFVAPLLVPPTKY